MRIKNWAKFQHFKDRRPPWIKLHREILDQRDIMSISSCSFKLLMCLWLLASEDEFMEGKLPNIEDISFRTRIPEPKIIELLPELTPWIDNLDIILISSRYQDGPPETETETERYKEEKEKEKKVKRFVPPSFQEVETYVLEMNYQVDAQKWFDYYSSNGWKVGKNKMVDWKAAIRTWNKSAGQTTRPVTFADAQEMRNQEQRNALIEEGWFND